MDNEFPPISREEITTWWNALVYSGCFYLLGAGIIASLAIFPIVLVCTHLNYGARWVLRGGFGLLVLTVLVTVGVMPETSKWRELKDSAIASATAILHEQIAARRD